MSNYDDIINLPHHVSEKHPQMPLRDRAAQFAPFAALTGHSAAVNETARLTESEISLDEGAISDINEALRDIKEHISAHPQVSVTYFEPDPCKDGGKYLSITAAVLKIDENRHVIVLEGGTEIEMKHIVRLHR